MADEPAKEAVMPTTVAPSDQPELSNAEKKKLAKAQKAARRAAAKDAAPPPSEKNATVPQSESSKESATSNGIRSPKGKEQGPLPYQGSKAKESIARQGVTEETGQAKVIDDQATKSEKALPIRTLSPTDTDEGKQVKIFSHLYGQTRKNSIDSGISKEVHPAILALGVQLSSYEICGSHARSVALLLALKSVVESYTTPLATSLPRHLASQHLSPQLAYIKSARPFSTTQVHAIRWLKNVIANVDPSLAEDIAKSNICDAIDGYLRDKLAVPSGLVANATARRISNGEVILTFAKSSVVQEALLIAARTKHFRVVAVDSRPLFEGRNFASTLSAAGIEVTYCMTSGLPHAMQDVTLCLLGAHAVLANGGLYSRVGTALVAMMAKQHRVPVIVCAESVKFTERTALDSIVVNELAPEDELIIDDAMDAPLTHAHKAAENEDVKSSMKDWRDKANLHLLNIMYDVTPAEMIDIVISEFGSIPPISALLVQRMNAGVVVPR